MTIQPPFIITSRLLPGIRVGDSTIAIKTIAPEWDGTQPFAVFIDTPGFSYEEFNARSGSLNSSYRSAMETTLTFLLAAVESARATPPGENADLFPPHVVEWAADHINELEDLWLLVQCLEEAYG